MKSQSRLDAEALSYQGTRCMESGDVAGAEACFRMSIRLAPDFADAYANLGLLLDRLGIGVEAETCYRRSIEINPDYPENHLNLGAFLANKKQFSDAEAAYKQAIALNPHSPTGWSNLGVLYACLRREAEAETCYLASLSLDASHATARFNFSYLLLRQGRFEEGWECLEARKWYSELAAHFTCPRWQGESLGNKSILICFEAGHGDVIQFCRYSALLNAQGAASITLICHPALKTLLDEFECVNTVLSYDKPIPPSGWDYWVPLLSLPYHFRTRIDSIPATIPYLTVPSERVSKWAGTLPADGFRVGLVWKGSAQFENDADRSLPSLELLAPLWAVPGVIFISLQKGAGEDEAAHPPSGLKLLNIGPMLEDFSDTAAVISCLDLVICVDTAVAHLSGALGKPCWVLLPEYKTDWRWLNDRADSPWYPGIMRLFRQPEIGDWATVINELVIALGQQVRIGRNQDIHACPPPLE